MKNLILVLAFSAPVAAFSQIHGTLNSGIGTTGNNQIGALQEVAAVKQFFNAMKQMTLDYSRVSGAVELQIAVSENQPVASSSSDGGHWFTAFAQLTGAIRKDNNNLALLSGSTPPIAYYFSDRLSSNQKHDPCGYAAQPFDVCKVETGKIRLQYSATNGGEITNINLFTKWQGWTIVAATVVSPTLLYGTLENGDVITMSYRFAPASFGR